ncbi:hypothetical protein PVIIG_06463 [Plasmodium vivax India VII]|uniref:Variable surface protein n=1 Tax=Plasmodium vivax India VII TaxID=1077284 RepID=A0A0J9S3K7_PLAVI|nr:hypothetical protein PVIIG_06463 [Plasmodium vivax India VII]
MLPFKQYKEIFDDIRDDSVTIGYYCSKYKSNLQNSQDNPCSNLESKCLIVSMYISKLEELHPNTMIEGCIFLYYMMYDKYIKKNSFGCDMLAFYKASLQDYCVNVDWEECNNFVEQIDVHRFEKYNNLIVFYENFDKLVKSGDDGESNKCSSAGECVQLYEKYIQECLGGVNNYYCNELKNFKHDYETKIKELSCTNVPTILTSAESNDLTSIIIFPVIIISALCFISYIVNKVNYIFLLKYISSTKIIYTYFPKKYYYNENIVLLSNQLFSPRYSLLLLALG